MILCTLLVATAFDESNKTVRAERPMSPLVAGVETLDQIEKKIPKPEKIFPLKERKYTGAITKGESKLYEFSLDQSKDYFVDVVARLDESNLMFGENLPLSLRTISDPDRLTNLGGEGKPEPLAMNIGAALLTAIQESTLCANCVRVQSSIKHSTGNHGTHWIYLFTETSLESIPPTDVQYTLFVSVRPRTNFIWFHAILFILLDMAAVSRILPVVYFFARAPNGMESLWGHLFFEELLSVPFLFLRKLVTTCLYIRRAFQEWQRNRGFLLQDEMHENLTDSLDAIECDADGDDIPTCRICLGSTEPLITPCKCTGSMSFVHLDCLDRWRTECFNNNPASQKVSACDVCLEPFEESIQYKRGDLLTRFMFAQIEGLSSSVGQIFSFWSFLFAWNLLTKYCIAPVVCCAPWHSIRDVSVWSFDAFLQSFFMFGALFAIFYLSAYYLFVSRHGHESLYSVRSLLFGALILSTCCYASAVVHFLVYLRSEIFVWDRALKLMPGIPVVCFILSFATLCVRIVTKTHTDRRSERVAPTERV
ncbi:hypothetical protein XU18_0383 [Perkinsela sp. CCAP 1560/4]|nr:hypothetical protein XU18_0383 [Perkinsela sp. CCAP 1560/4]|eukprot:KNH09698.1 hypothetical protein XU18_0383 [Perkinsela sp. CCAP 1560/4]